MAMKITKKSLLTFCLIVLTVNWRESARVYGSPGSDDTIIYVSDNALYEMQKDEFQLKNFPNPFINSTSISFVLGQASE